MSAESDKSKSPTRLESAATTLIVMTTIIGALVAWRAALSASAAGSSDNAGLRSMTWAQTSKTTHTVDAYEDYRLFLKYKLHSELGDYIEGSQEGAKGEEASALAHEQEEARKVAEINVSFLDESLSSRYLTRDGSFAVGRELGEKWAADARRYDMNPEPHFRRADRYRERKKSQLRAGILLTLALLFYTLFRVIGGSARFFFFGIAVTLTTCGSLWALLLERGA